MTVRVSPVRRRPSAQIRLSSESGLRCRQPKVATEVLVTPVGPAKPAAAQTPAAQPRRIAVQPVVAAAAAGGLSKRTSLPLFAQQLTEVCCHRQQPLSPGLHSGRRECQALGLQARSLSPRPVAAERAPAKKPGMCLAEWSAARQLTPRPDSPTAACRTRQRQQARLSPSRASKILRPCSRLKSIKEATEASQLEAAKVGLEEAPTVSVSVSAGSEESPDDEEPDVGEPEASPTEPQEARSPGGGFCLRGEPAARESSQEVSTSNCETEMLTPPPSAKCVWNTPFGWAAALDQGGGTEGGACGSDSDVLKPWKWATQPEALRPEPALSQRTGGCSLPPVGASTLGWANQENHLIVHLSLQTVLVAVFDGHGENAALAARPCSLADVLVLV